MGKRCLSCRHRRVIEDSRGESIACVMRSGKEIPESGMPPWDMRPVSGILEFPVEPEESESYMNIGDSVIMNEKYVVAEKNQGKVFTVRSQHFDICGTECVMLEGYSGGYAVDGLTVVGKRISGREAVAQLFR